MTCLTRSESTCAASQIWRAAAFRERQCKEMEVPTVDADIKPAVFWRDYVSQRKPVVIKGSHAWMQQWTDDFLADAVGDVPVMVEQRGSARDGYGQGRKVPMRVRQLISAMQQGDSSLYMSTQEVGTSRVDGHPLLYGPPLLQLAGHFPLQQPLMGGLVPQSINMWMGCAPEGSSSGLHHDFHDNLYGLLRGVKRFRLFPPATAPRMYLAGRLAHVHANGRIVYAGQGAVNADGSDAHDVRLWQAHVQADAAAAAAAAGGSADDAGAAEAVLEQQLDAMLDEAADGAGLDDYMSDSHDDAAANDDSDSDSDGQQWDSDGSAAGSDAAAKAGATPRSASRSRARAAAAAAAGGSMPLPAAAAPPPPSFSGVDLSLPEKELRQRFPLFPGLSSALEVVLQAGDMLYLPAGWFHEVTSFGAPGLDGGHLAMNWWFHPPDNLDSSKRGFSQPYTTTYYPSLWAQRRARLHQETLDWWQHKAPQQQQQQPAAAGAAAVGLHATKPAGAAAGATTGKKRRIGWAADVGSPPNKYRMGMTRDGLATGNIHQLPSGGGGPGGSRQCAGVIAANDSDGSDTESPCSSRPADSSRPQPAAAAAAAAGSSSAKKRGARRELTPLLPSSVQEPGDPDPSDDAAGAAAAAGAGADGSSGNGDADADLSSATKDAMDAVDGYFSGRLDAMDAVREMMARALSREMSRRRRRPGGGQQQEPGGLALPVLPGRRHHYTVSIRVVPRRPAPQ